MYNLSTLLAAVSHLECDRGPGSRIEKSSGQYPDLIALDISNKHYWSLLNTFLSTSGIKQSTGS